jgi:hypothetical protein
VKSVCEEEPSYDCLFWSTSIRLKSNRTITAKGRNFQLLLTVRVGDITSNIVPPPVTFYNEAKHVPGSRTLITKKKAGIDIFSLPAAFLMGCFPNRFARQRGGLLNPNEMTIYGHYFSKPTDKKESKTVKCIFSRWVAAENKLYAAGEGLLSDFKNSSKVVISMPNLDDGQYVVHVHVLRGGQWIRNEQQCLRITVTGSSRSFGALSFSHLTSCNNQIKALSG